MIGLLKALFIATLSSLALSNTSFVDGFIVPNKCMTRQTTCSGASNVLNSGSHQEKWSTLMMSSDSSSKSESSDDGVVELATDILEDEPTTKEVTAPFLSQGEVSEDAMNADLSDPKQVRVIFYTIISLLPVLFLIPLMLGSRDLIPLDAAQLQ